MFKTIVITLLGLIVASLFSALFHLARDQGHGARAVKALTLRVSLSVLLFAVLMTSFYLGFSHPY